MWTRPSTILSNIPKVIWIVVVYVFLDITPNREPWSIALCSAETKEKRGFVPAPRQHYLLSLHDKLVKSVFISSRDSSLVPSRTNSSWKWQSGRKKWAALLLSPCTSDSGISSSHIQQLSWLDWTSFCISRTWIRTWASTDLLSRINTEAATNHCMRACHNAR